MVFGASHVAPSDVGDEGQLRLEPFRVGLPKHPVEIVAQVKCHKAVAEELVHAHGAETAWRIQSEWVVSAQDVEGFHYRATFGGIAGLQLYPGNAPIAGVEVL